MTEADRRIREIEAYRLAWLGRAHVIATAVIIAVAVVTIAGVACVTGGKPRPQIPSIPPVCAEISDPALLIACVLANQGATPAPRATTETTPRATATSTDAPETPKPTASPTPKPTGVRIDPVPCVKNTSKKGRLHKYVLNAQAAYHVKHPERFLGKQLAAVWWDDFYFAVVDHLNASGFVKAVVDDCAGNGICGEIGVKPFGNPRGEGFHEQYHVLVSNGDLRLGDDSYRTTCAPAGF